MPEPNLTPRQQKWFASVRDGLERETGRPMADWVAIARSCPATTQRSRLAWLKAEHGLLQNRAMWVLKEAFGNAAGWDDPQALIQALWSDPASKALMDAIDAHASALEGTLRTARKGFTAWSRTVQFAAARPVRSGGAVLGLALAPGTSGLLSPTRSEPWSDRLKSRLTLTHPPDVDDGVRSLLAAAWEVS
ncbi:DUF4287 domain-containing protein [Lichenicola sp.]|uniref:DUF4287 domain-containing protein n=1 Tax=Lichenicola sp. TaxID=2804529 RepID=UPI003B00F407